MTRRFHSVAALALALAVTACGLSPEERLDRAETAFAQNRFTEARLDLASVLEEDAGNAEALEMLARTHLQLGDGESAWHVLERLTAQGARLPDHDTLAAEAQLLRGNHAEALALAETLGSAEGARIAALALVGQGETAAAAERFEKGLKASGPRARLFADYAIFALQAGDGARADSLATQARQADVNALDPLFASARVAQATGDLAAALAHYEKAAADWPESRVAMLGRIGVLGDLGRMEEARPLIAEAARRSPGDPDIVYLQARLAAEDGEWRAVRDALQPLEASDQARVQLLYARSLVELGLTEAAMPRLAALMRRAPGNAAARRLLAHAQFDSGDAARAHAMIGPLAESANAAPQDLALYAQTGGNGGGSASPVSPAERVGTLLAQGDAALQAGNWRAAIDAYERLRGFTAKDNALVLNNLAYARSRTGDLDTALGLAEQALALAPDNPNVMDTAGWLFVRTGRDRSRGLTLLEDASRRAPQNAAIAAHLRQARGR